MLDIAAGELSLPGLNIDLTDPEGQEKEEKEREERVKKQVSRKENFDTG